MNFYLAFFQAFFSGTPQKNNSLYYLYLVYKPLIPKVAKTDFLGFSFQFFCTHIFLYAFTLQLQTGAGHQADGTSSRIVKLGTSSRIIPYKVVKYEQFENFFEEFLNFMIFLHQLLAFAYNLSLQMMFRKVEK